MKSGRVLKLIDVVSPSPTLTWMRRHSPPNFRLWRPRTTAKLSMAEKELPASTVSWLFSSVIKPETTNSSLLSLNGPEMMRKSGERLKPNLASLITLGEKMCCQLSTKLCGRTLSVRKPTPASNGTRKTASSTL